MPPGDAYHHIRFHFPNTDGSVIFSVFGALRVYAVTDRDWRSTLFALALGFVPVATNIVGIVQSVFVVASLPDGQLWCSQERTVSPSLAHRLVIATRSCTIAFDVCVISILWCKCWQAWRMSQALRQGTSLTQLLLKDGTSLFGFLLVLNILDIILWLTMDFEWITTLFLSPISCTLICRCLLNLREVSSPPRSTADLDTIRLTFVHSFGEDQESHRQTSATLSRDVCPRLVIR
ncbi:uncharacterized protein B0H18DRAFT_281699 [Fomitopsis serialis]|uniref:uncharacterized protein n=1 Tax=Fomitopsis serialis TaxID=139415 RepID=UPI00200820B9|nr:uncharacterized protein B0H18DRAFT_281699 [Neoantrodia serialis]KAH9927631.1 hypothetical protein B0H18DRAFT_281699 [Neoantrodia serialis]